MKDLGIRVAIVLTTLVVTALVVTLLITHPVR